MGYWRLKVWPTVVEYVNIWMGHKTDYKALHIPASDVHYFSREDVEFQRKLYAEKALPFLKLETATPTETEKIIARQQKEMEEVRERVKQLSQVDRDFAAFLKEAGQKVDEKLARIEKFEKFLKAKYPKIYREFKEAATNG